MGRMKFENFGAGFLTDGVSKFAVAEFDFENDRDGFGFDFIDKACDSGGACFGLIRATWEDRIIIQMIVVSKVEERETIGKNESFAGGI